VWSDLKEQIAVEQAEIHELVVFHREFLDACQRREPAGIEITAAGAFLHALYSGIENICRRIAIELDGGLPAGGGWHRRLLQAMTQPTEARPQVISEPLHDRLLEYLDFRHLFRNVYVFRLQWERMMDLVLNVEDLVQDLNQQLASFSQQMDEIADSSPTSSP
jgi:HepT-like protein